MAELLDAYVSSEERHSTVVPSAGAAGSGPRIELF
jgi:hypothetical protein